MHSDAMHTHLCSSRACVLALAVTCKGVTWRGAVSLPRFPRVVKLEPSTGVGYGSAVGSSSGGGQAESLSARPAPTRNQRST